MVFFLLWLICVQSMLSCRRSEGERMPKPNPSQVLYFIFISLFLFVSSCGPTSKQSQLPADDDSSSTLEIYGFDLKFEVPDDFEINHTEIDRHQSHAHELTMVSSTNSIHEIFVFNEACQKESPQGDLLPASEVLKSHIEKNTFLFDEAKVISFGPLPHQKNGRTSAAYFYDFEDNQDDKWSRWVILFPTGESQKCVFIETVVDSEPASLFSKDSDEPVALVVEKIVDTMSWMNKS